MRKIIFLFVISTCMTGCSLLRSKTDGIHAKNLFSRAEIERTLNAKVSQSQILTDAAEGSALRFSIGDSSFVQITVTRPAMFVRRSDPQTSIQAIRKATTIKKTVTVNGVGDSAFWDGDTFHFVKKDCYVTIHFEPKNIPVSLEKAKTLASLAASRIY